MPSRWVSQSNERYNISDYIVDLFEDKKFGKVHSLFSTSINLVISDRLINITSNPDFLSSYGMQVPEAVFYEIKTYCEVNTRVIVKNGELWFYGRGREIILLPKQYKVIQLTLPVGSVENFVESNLIERLETLDFENKIGIPSTPKSKKVIQYLMEGALSDYEMNQEAIRHLVGRGLGLTPSGDDLLMGFTMCLLSVGKGKLWLRQLEQMIDDQTTDISLAYFNALFDYRVSNIMVNLFTQVHLGQVDGIDQCVEQILNYGHTSGIDTLYGIYIGAKWLKAQMCD